MGGRGIARGLVIGALALGSACSSFEIVPAPEGEGGAEGDGDSDGSGGGASNADGGVIPGAPGADASPIEDRDDDGSADAFDNCPDLANEGQADGDGDDFGDACDCDPDSSALAGTLLLDDDLADDRSLFEPAPGFADDTWSYEQDGYHQTRVGNDASDVSLLQLGRPIRNVRIDVVLASTDWDEYDTEDLRQIMLVARVDARADSYAAVACGIEVVEGMEPTTRTSVVTYAGSPGAPAPTGIDRTPRDSVSASEPVTSRMELVDGQMTCRATIDGEVSEATGTVPDRYGAIGFETRESASLFKDVRVCELP